MLAQYAGGCVHWTGHNMEWGLQTGDESGDLYLKLVSREQLALLVCEWLSH